MNVEEKKGRGRPIESKWIDYRIDNIIYIYIQYITVYYKIFI